ncbi:hypothetical protein D3C73_1572290 [compost metagenome]
MPLLYSAPFSAKLGCDDEAGLVWLGAKSIMTLMLFACAVEIRFSKSVKLPKAALVFLKSLGQ